LERQATKPNNSKDLEKNKVKNPKVQDSLNETKERVA